MKKLITLSLLLSLGVVSLSHTMDQSASNAAKEYNFYEVLGIPATAKQSEVKKAYFKLARTAHPDRGGSKERFQQIQQAYEVLKDEKARKEYDTALKSNFFNFKQAGKPQAKVGSREQLEQLIIQVQKGQSYDEAIQAALAGFTSDDRLTRLVALNLFIELVKQDQAIDDAIRVVIAGQLDESSMIQEKSEELKKILQQKDKWLLTGMLFGLLDSIEKGKDEKLVIMVAQEAIQSDNFQNKLMALRLFINLVEKDKAFNQAVKAAQVGLNDKVSLVKKFADDLKKLLQQKGKWPKEETKQLQEELKKIKEMFGPYKSNTSKDAEKAFEIAQKGMSSTDENTQLLALDLFSQLVSNFSIIVAPRKKSNIAVIINAGNKGVSTNNPKLQMAALRLFKTYIVTLADVPESIYTNAESAAKRVALSENKGVQRQAEALREWAVIGRKITRANKSMRSSYEMDHATGLGIFIDLVENSKNIIGRDLVNKLSTWATLAAEQGLNAKNSGVRKSANKLKELLQQKKLWKPW